MPFMPPGVVPGTHDQGDRKAGAWSYYGVLDVVPGATPRYLKTTHTQSIPYVSEKPISPSGVFAPIWYRFFLNLYRQTNKTNNNEAEVSFGETSGVSFDGGNVGSRIDELEVKQNVDFETLGIADLQKRIDELEAKIAVLETNSTDSVDPVEVFMALSQNHEGYVRTKGELWLNIGGLKAPGANPATEIAHGLDTAWQFADAIEANQESISGRIRVPISMDISIAPIGYIGWSADGVSPGDCKWQIEYNWLAVNEATNAAAQETLTVVSTASATSNGLIVAEVTGLDSPSINDQAIDFRITRLSSDAEDTIADTTELLGVAMRFTLNKYHGYVA
jgi:hypothetical protein